MVFTDKNGYPLKEGQLVRLTMTYKDYQSGFQSNEHFQVIPVFSECGERVLTVNGRELGYYHGANGYCMMEVIGKTD